MCFASQKRRLFRRGDTKMRVHTADFLNTFLRQREATELFAVFVTTRILFGTSQISWPGRSGEDRSTIRPAPMEPQRTESSQDFREMQPLLCVRDQ